MRQFVAQDHIYPFFLPIGRTCRQHDLRPKYTPGNQDGGIRALQQLDPARQSILACNRFPDPPPWSIHNRLTRRCQASNPQQAESQHQQSEQCAANNGFEVFSEREGYRQDDEPLIDGYEVWSALFEARQSLAEFYAARYAAYKYHPDP